MCHYLGGGLHGKRKRVKAQSESSKSVVNSVLISREMPVFPGFLEIIRVVGRKNRMKDSPDMMIGVDSGRLLCKLNKICGNSKKREQIEIICKYLENENGRSKKEIYIPMPVKDAVQCFGERDLAKLPKSTFRVWE